MFTWFLVAAALLLVFEFESFLSFLAWVWSSALLLAIIALPFAVLSLVF